MASGGYGRGGRGAALRQALQQPTKKPGESEANEVSRTRDFSNFFHEFTVLIWHIFQDH